MNNWAVVIGVDKYASPRLNLKGAVRDALAVAAYLTEGPTPLVDRARLKLLLSRTDDSPNVPAAFDVVEASRKNIVATIKDLVTKPEGRLFVHFSGHGLMAPGLTGGEAILPTDYDAEDPVQSIQIDGLRDYLRTSNFDEQFFFIDACRNTPIEGNFNIGPFSETPDPQRMRPEVQQFVFCATLRGVTAGETRSPNDERGVFTEPLIRGLRGAGRAKIFDENTGVYEVTAGRLLRFVRDEVRKTIAGLNLPAAADNTTPQEPRLLGEIGDTEAVVVTIPPARVDPVTLTFDIAPAEASAGATVRVVGENETRTGPPITAATQVALPPRDYRVFVEATGFTSAKSSFATQLYEDTRLSLALQPAPAGPAPFQSFAAPPSASLEFWSSDPLAAVRVVDARGQTVAVGKEGVTVTGIKPGDYRGQLFTSAGAIVERAITIERGSQEHVEVAAPGSPTPLSLRLDETPDQRSERLAAYLITDEQTIRLPEAADRPGAGLHSFVLDDKVLNVVAPLVDGWVTRLLLDRRDNRASTAAMLFLPPEADNGSVLGTIEAAESHYQNGLFDSALALLGSDLANPMAALVASYCRLRLLFLTRFRPIGARLTAASQLALLQEQVGLLDERFPALSDVKLLQAELAILTGAAAPIASCQAALDRGLPLFAFGAVRLAAHVAAFDIQHANRALLQVVMKERIAGWPWTAWTAFAASGQPGRPL